MHFPVCDLEKGEEMKALIAAVKAAGDSIGGTVETATLGLPAGFGSPHLDSLEGRIARYLFGIPAVKGVAFGDGFALAAMRGSVANDCYRLENDTVVTATNHNGGILGGLATGMPLLVTTALKPTPSIALPQKTLNFATGKVETLEIKGRHDPCVVPRAAIVVTSAVALALTEAALEEGW
jgi:chorismate synthase